MQINSSVTLDVTRLTLFPDDQFLTSHKAAILVQWQTERKITSFELTT